MAIMPTPVIKPISQLGYQPIIEVITNMRSHCDLLDASPCSSFSRKAGHNQQVDLRTPATSTSSGQWKGTAMDRNLTTLKFQVVHHPPMPSVALSCPA
jgi:hypothetical protein